MQTKEEVEKKTQGPSPADSEESKGGGRLDGRDAKENSESKAKSESEARDRTPA